MQNLFKRDPVYLPLFEMLPEVGHCTEFLLADFTGMREQTFVYPSMPRKQKIVSF